MVGCGNLLRGDDGVGPVLIRHLWDRGVPTCARLVDGGTAGMDVAFQMRGARRVVIVDASATGAAPGTIYRVPGEELGELPPLEGLHTHSFRWDHAIAFARWALAEACPTDITVFLIEAAGVDLGAELSEPVQTAMEQVIELIERDYLGPVRPRLGAGGRRDHRGRLSAGRRRTGRRAVSLRCPGCGAARRTTVVVPAAGSQ